jgi:hypothetical protein
VAAVSFIVNHIMSQLVEKLFQQLNNEPILLFYVVALGLFIYILKLFQEYKKTVNDVLEYNKKLGVPIKFSYSWIRGVKIEPLENNMQKIIPTPNNNKEETLKKKRE